MIGKSHYIKQQIEDLEKRGSIQQHLSISIAEHFTPYSFLAKLRSCQSTWIGVHFNLSAYSPFSLVAQFFYHLVLFGLLWDPFTGDMEHVTDDIVWHIFIELNYAPVADPLFAHVSTPEQVIRSLPILKLAAQFITKYDMPLREDDEVILCCTFFEAWQNELLFVGSHEIVCDLTSPSQNVQHLLSQLFAMLPLYNIHLPALKYYHKMFLQFLADRCIWLRNYALYPSQKSSFYLFGYLVQCQHTDMNITDSYDFGRLFRMFMEESGHLCERKLKTTLSLHPPIYSSRSSLPYPPDVAFFDFGYNDMEGLPNVLDLNTALAFPAKLRVKLAPGLGLHHTDRMVQRIQQQNYVLTSDFALKLLILNEKRKANQNVILSGGDAYGHALMIDLCRNWSWQN